MERLVNRRVVECISHLKHRINHASNSIVFQGLKRVHIFHRHVSAGDFVFVALYWFTWPHSLERVSGFLFFGSNAVREGIESELSLQSDWPTVLACFLLHCLLYPAKLGLLNGSFHFEMLRIRLRSVLNDCVNSRATQWTFGYEWANRVKTMVVRCTQTSRISLFVSYMWNWIHETDNLQNWNAYI